MPVLSVTDSQETDAAGELVNVFEIVYQIPDRPGSFTFTVPRQPDPVAAAEAEIAKLTSAVGSIYGLG